MSYTEGRLQQVQAWAEATQLMVLVWGPAKSPKREKIRAAVRDHFRAAEVFFSEDPELKTLLPRWLQDGDILTQELAHLAACDVCVILDESKGPGEEIAHFVKSRYASKLLVLTHEDYADVGSFPAGIRDPLRRFGNQLFYSEEAYKSCSLVELVIDRIRAVGFQKYSASLE
jgi:hypothetical protein